MKFNKINFEINLLKDYAKKLLDNGFKIYVSPNRDKRPITYFNFVKDNKIGYCQIEHYCYLALSSVHKPCSHAGTGYRIYSEITKPTIEQAETTLNTIKPHWERTREPIVKYSNWKEKQAGYESLKYVEVSK